MAAAILLDFFLDLRFTFYLVLVTMLVVVVVASTQLIITAPRLRRWLRDRRLHRVEGERHGNRL